MLPLRATKNSPSVARLALGGLGNNSGIPTGSPSPTLLATEIPGLFPKGLRRARQCAQDGGQNPLQRLEQPQVAAGPHPLFCIGACFSVHICWHAKPVPTSRRAMSGPAHRGACAQVRWPRAAALPPTHTHTFRARASPAAAHGHGHAPRRWSCPPRALGGPCTPARAIPLPRALRGRGSHLWSSRPAPTARSPPRSGDSGRFEFTTGRPVPNLAAPPLSAGFPAPRDYRSCRGSVPVRRLRPGGGAGQVTRAALPPGRPAEESPPPTPLPWQPPALVWPRAGAPVSQASVPAEEARPWATSWTGCGHCVWATRTGYS